MNVALTIFKSIFDNKTHREMNFGSFDELENLLYCLSKKPGYKPKKGEFNKAASELITPAIFHKGTTRANKNVISWGGWVAIDVDDYPNGGFEDAVKAFNGHRYVCYSSASSRKEHPKFRMVMPLTQWIPADKIRHFWYALNREFNSLADPQTKDLSRMYYIPAQYPDAYNFIFSNKSAPILNPAELMDKHTFSEKASIHSLLAQMPEAIQKKMEEYKRDQLKNGHKYRWTSYADCPFVNKRLVQEYRSISGTGWYTKMYAIMTSIAATAIRRGYPITAEQIAQLCKQLDMDTGGWYKNRPMELEAARALSFALKAT